MNLAWYLFYGRKLGMSKHEIYWTPIGEMNDMLACLAVYEGTAKIKNNNSKIKLEDLLRLE